MKTLRNILCIFSIVFTISSTLAQKETQNPFSGKVFRIDNYINEKFDNSEDLTFSEKHVEGSICVQYGFKKAKYTSKLNASKLWEFSCTMVSDEHGKMVWKGEKYGSTITGSYLWTKEGQDPILYTFKGKLK